MRYKDFQLISRQWFISLFENRPISFSEAIKKAKTHERIRNISVLYSLTSQSAFQELVRMAKQDLKIKQMLADLQHALQISMHPISDILISLFFSTLEPSFLAKEKSTSAHLQIAKVLRSMIRHHDLEKQRTNEEEEYVREVLSRIKIINKDIDS